MKKTNLLKAVFLSMVLMLMVVPAAMGYQLDITRIGGYYAGNGGEFNITPLTGFPVSNVLSYYSSSAIVNNGFESFCVEQNETVAIPGSYNAVLNSGAVAGGVGGQTSPGFDPLSKGTAYLYSMFAAGTLNGYNYGIGRSGSAWDLQNAIWYLEQEGGFLTASYTTLLENTFGTIANAMANNNGLYSVGVLNLTAGDGRHQDQLVMTPEPGSLLLFGIGLLGATALRRKLKRS
jgi:hypothetical protein